MINLDACVGSDVFIQFKTGVYIIVCSQGRLQPVLLPAPAETPGRPMPPAVADRMEGRLSKRDGAFIVSYANPVNPTEQIDYVLDPENVSGAWVQRAIAVVPNLAALATPGSAATPAR